VLPLEDHIEDSKYIFIAQITSVEKVNEIIGVKPASSGIKAQFKSSDALKGNPTELGFLYSGSGGGDCGLQLKEGDKYLFFTNNGYVSICGANEKNFNDLSKYKK